MRNFWLTGGAVALALSNVSGNSAAAAPAAGDAAAGAAVAPDDTLQEVIVTGTRQSGVKAADSAAPIQLVGSSALKQLGQQDLRLALAQNLPSLNVQAFGSDTANLTLSAALRGLNPNDTLVLVNGKRLHGTANLAVDGTTPYQGAAAADLSFIPVAAIDHVEVLEDGAAAQYGSDAIAGVVNIILKQNKHGGSVSGTGGAYYQGDGGTGDASYTQGFHLGRRGFLDVTGEMRHHGFSQRGGADRRYSNLDGSLQSGLGSLDAAGIPQSPGYPRENKIDGDAKYDLYSLMYNAGYDFGDVHAYSFGSYGYREGWTYQNYRPPSKVTATDASGNQVVPFPAGFSPLENMRENSFSFTAGLKGIVADWNWDLSSTYGQDKDRMFTLDSANKDLLRALQAAAPNPIPPQRNFYDGAFVASESTSNLDFVRSFDVGLTAPLTVAFGGEMRKDWYRIDQGEAASIYGAGPQGYPGFQPTDTGTHGRTNYAGYVDVTVDPVRHWLVDLAGRAEHYSDFGSATVGKLTTRFDFTRTFAIRGTVSTGFRAPTLAEEYYSATNVDPTFASVQLPPNSPAAALAGFSPLKPEKSTNISFGFVFHPEEALQVTLDAYQIDIRDRIVGSGFLLGSEQGSTSNLIISQGVLDAIQAHGNVLDSGISYAGITIFTNGADTRTRGAELTANYLADFGDAGRIDWNAGFDYVTTTITRLQPLPAQVTNASVGQTYLLSPTAISALTTAMPKAKATLGMHYRRSRWSLNLVESIYGPSSEVFSLDGTGTNGTDVKINTTAITDLNVGYQVTEALHISIGADNLFNRTPPSQPNVPNGHGGVRPADGDSVYFEPDAFSPFGIDGGYYWGRVTYNF
jgi:iron complex outermembrane receptor protein